MQKRNMAILHYQVGETDGVSLEIDKWKAVFEQMGHQVTLVAGHLGAAKGYQIDEIYHHSEVAARLRDNMFWGLNDYADDAAFRAELESASEAIEAKLEAFIETNQIDFLVAENVWSVVAHPAVALAVGRIMKKYQLPSLAHSHDFYWEKIGDYSLSCPTAIELAQKYLPPRNPLVRHAVINQRSQQQLFERMGINSVVVPNTFDFDNGDWVVDNYNQDFLGQVGIRENDVVILQATRIIQRKGIELAVDFVKALNTPERRAKLKENGLYDGRPFGDESRIILVLAGYAQDDTTGWYVDHLKQKIAQAGIDALFIEDWIGGDRSTKDGHKVYSLWDSYVFADFVTYPSFWEGWGNQLLEALRAKLPVMLFEYPVYVDDIKPTGLELVSIGDRITGKDPLGLVQVPPENIEFAADEAIILLTNPVERQRVVEKNYNIARQHYSIPALSHYLENILLQFEA